MLMIISGLLRSGSSISDLISIIPINSLTYAALLVLTWILISIACTAIAAYVSNIIFLRLSDGEVVPWQARWQLINVITACICLISLLSILPNAAFMGAIGDAMPQNSELIDTPLDGVYTVLMTIAFLGIILIPTSFIIRAIIGRSKPVEQQ